MLIVTTPSALKALTTVDTVKAELSITTTDEDDYLEALIPRVSAAICSHLGLVRADDGSLTLGRETLVETIRLENDSQNLMLSRRPIVSVTSVTRYSDVVPAERYEARPMSGLLKALICDRPSCWSCGKYVVTYVAGWLLPDQDGRNLPEDIEQAAIAEMKAVRFNRSRDPALKSENILESLYSYELFGPDKQGTQGVLVSPEAASLLQPYKDILIG